MVMNRGFILPIITDRPMARTAPWGAIGSGDANGSCSAVPEDEIAEEANEGEKFAREDQPLQRHAKGRLAELAAQWELAPPIPQRDRVWRVPYERA